MIQFYHDYKYQIWALTIFIVALIVNRIIRVILDRYFIKVSDNLKTDPTNYVYLKNILSFLIFSLALFCTIYVVPSLRSFALTLFAGAGIIVAIVGFASQQAFTNIVSGLFIVIFKPFRVGDLIDVENGKIGIVENITLRHTVIVDFTNKRVIIPNSVISNETVINYTIEDQKLCLFYEVGVAYDSDFELIMRRMEEVILKHPLCIDMRTPEDIEAGVPRLDIRTIELDESSVKVRAYIWMEEPKLYWRLKHDLNRSILADFKEHGIKIPYPHRVVLNAQ